MSSVIVIGAGLAGLGCALRLKQAGHDVQVLERDGGPGGRMRSEAQGRYCIDRGAQFVSGGYRNLLGVAREIGLSGALRPVAGSGTAILHGGRIWPALDSPLALLRTRLLSPRARRRLVRLGFELLRQRRRLDPWRPELAAALDGDDLVSTFTRLAGAETTERLLAPAFAATFDCEPEQLSGAFGLLALRLFLGGGALHSFEGGNGLFTRALAERVGVRVGFDVVRVETDDGGVHVHFVTPSGERSLAADAAVLAVPGGFVPGLCPSLTDEENAFFGQVRYNRGLLVFLMLEKAPPQPAGFGLDFPRALGLDLYGLTLEHKKAGAAPDGAGLLSVALRSAAAERLFEESDDTIAQHVLAELERTPIGRLDPVGVVVHRHDPLLPVFGPGSLRALSAFRRRRAPTPRLAFAGDYLMMPTLEGALTSGERAAAELRGQLGS